DLVEDLDPVPLDVAVGVRVPGSHADPPSCGPRLWPRAFDRTLQRGCNRAATRPGRMPPIGRPDRERGGEMAITQEKEAAQGVVYDLQGSLLEACSWGVMCPCWIGEDPDGGSCDAFVAYHFDAGNVKGVDIGGLALVNVVQIPGNVLTPGSWKVAMFVDERATDEQFNGLVDAYSGQLGGPPARLARLVRQGPDAPGAPLPH